MTLYPLAQLLHTLPKKDKDPSFRVAPAIEILKKYLPEGQRVLDIGPRNAIEPTLLRAAGWEVEAVDLWPMAPGIRRAAMEALPYPTVSFDAAVLIHSLEHARDLEQAGREITRVLRPGAIVLVEVPVGADPNPHDRHRFDLAEDVLRPFAKAGGRPQLLQADRRGGALRVLFRLDRRLRVLLCLTGSLHERNWKQSGLVDRMWTRGWYVMVTGPSVSSWRAWLRRGPLRTASYVTRARRWATYRHKLALRERRALRYRLANRAWHWLARIVEPERLAQVVERCLPGQGLHESFREVRPDVVVVPTTIHEGLEVDLAKAAKRLGIPVVAHVAGFDTLTSKGAFIGWRPDRLLVWGEDAKRWALEAHGFRPEEVVITGAPQHDPFFQGCDPPPPFSFVYVPGSTLSWWADAKDILAGLLAGLPPEVRVCHTPHPQAHMDVGALAEALWLPPWPDGWQWDQSTFRTLGMLLAAAKCVVSPWSTLVVEAALVGTPSVLVGFGKGLAAYGEWEHLAPVKAWPGIFIARSMEELVATVRRLAEAPKSMWAAATPGLWNDLAVVAQQVARADGRAGERIMQAIEEVALRKDAVQ